MEDKEADYITPKSWDLFRVELFESFWGIKYDIEKHKDNIIMKL